MFAKRFLLISAGLLCLSLPSSATAQTFISTWGTYGTGNGQFLTPQGVAVGGSGDIYVSDGDNNRVQVFTSGGSYLRQWSLPLDPGENHWARNLTVDANDNVYVTDFNAELVIKYTSTGILLTQWGGQGSGPGQFGNTSGQPHFSLAIDASGSVYVADNANNRVQVFTPDGAYIREFGTSGSGDGQFNNPDGLALDAAGNIYVADKGNSRIQKFTNAGTYVTKWGSNGTGDGQFGGPVRIAIGPEGNVYVVDHELSRVQAFTRGGVFITKWGSYGASTGQFYEPIGIAVDADGDIYVADKSNYRIQKFRFEPTPVQSVTWGSVKTRYRGERGAAQPATQDR